MPGNVFLPFGISGLTHDTVINVTARMTLNQTDLTRQSGIVPLPLIDEIDKG